MFTNLFYLVILFLAIDKIYWILTPQARVAESKDFKATTLSLKNTPFPDWPSGYAGKIGWLYFRAFLGALLFLGLISEQWLVFLILLVWIHLVVTPVTMLFKNRTIIWTAFHWINKWILLAVYFFLVINHYHLKLSSAWVFQFLKSYLWS